MARSGCLVTSPSGRNGGRTACHFRALPLIVRPRHRHGLGIAEIVDADPVGLSRRDGRQRGDDRDAEGDRAHRQGNVGRAGRRTVANSAGSNAVMVVPMFCEIAIIFGPDDIVAALGQDGLVANTMKYLNDHLRSKLPRGAAG